MDPVSLVYYGLICACLGAAAPAMPRLSLRVAIGALIGVLAASLLPLLRAATGL